MTLHHDRRKRGRHKAKIQERVKRMSIPAAVTCSKEGILKVSDSTAVPYLKLEGQVQGLTYLKLARLTN